MLKSTTEPFTELFRPPGQATGQATGQEAVRGAWHVHPGHLAPLPDTYAWEERRFAAMREGIAGPMHHVWTPQESLSISRAEARRIGLDEIEPAETLGIRATGGTVVPQGKGTANLTLFTRHREHPGIRKFYTDWCAALAEGFETLGLTTTVGPCEGSFCDGEFNLLLDGRKLVGTAQRWGRARDGSTIGHHHAVVMMGADPAVLCRRVDALYRQAGFPDRADPGVHASPALDIVAVRRALAPPLQRLLRRA